VKVSELPTRPLNQGTWPLLSGLRFLFATWVLFAHTYNFGLHSRAMPVPSQSGLVAVVCFFAISGFSIHHSIKTRPSGYYRRRFWRIFPIHITAVTLALAGYAVLGHIFDGHGREYPIPGAFQWLQYYLLIQVFFYPNYIDVLFPMWSLSIEAIYYAIAPAIIPLTHRTLLIFVAASGVALLFWRFFGEAAIAPYGLQIFTFAWAWLAGWIAYGRPRNWIAAGLLIIVGWIFIKSQPEQFWLVNKISIMSTYSSWAVTVILLFFPLQLSLSELTKRGLNYLGDISFPLYLIHYPVLFALTSSIFKTHPEWNYGIVHVIVSFAAASIVYRFIDKPYRHFGEGSIPTPVVAKLESQV
jgi:peptidoglycan/LPS O-acetylase OafA/YrhL